MDSAAFLTFISLSFIGYVFPAIVTALVPFRFYVLPRCFHQNDLKHLDPFAENEEEQQLENE